MKINSESGKNVWEKVKKTRYREWIIVLVLAAVLVVVLLSVFKREDSKNVAISSTSMEERLETIVLEIGGFSTTQVMIGEDDDGIKSVVITCVGDKDLQAIMDVREAVATLVGTSESNVKIYFR